MKMVCDVCKWVYDPDTGHPDANIPPGTPWENVSEDFVCPECGAGKNLFLPE